MAQGSVKEPIRLPSEFQPHDKVGLQMLIDLMERAANGTVTKVSFLIGKVKYDIQIPVMARIDGDVTGYFRIANLDSALLNPPYNNGFHYNSDRDRDLRDHEDRMTIPPTEESHFSGAGWYTSKEIPAIDQKEEDLTEYVLIDPDGWRKTFHIGYYNTASKSWQGRDSDFKIDLDHMRWTNLPFNKEKLR